MCGTCLAGLPNGVQNGVERFVAPGLIYPAVIMAGGVLGYLFSTERNAKRGAVTGAAVAGAIMYGVSLLQQRKK